MSHSIRHYPIGPVGGVQAGTGRYFKRAKAKQERAGAKHVLLAGALADFAFTPPRTYDIGDGKIWHQGERARKLLRK